MRAFVVAFMACALICLGIVPAQAETPASPVTITGLDAHDGTVVQDPDTGYLYLYGTRYGCGYRWGAASPWCGFGVWRSTEGVEGPWVFQRLLFAPSSQSTWAQRSWTALCGTSGSGCFNPRMVRRADGIWVLWFNAPNDWSRTGANAYYVMGCAGPAGPCGPGAENGSLSKPRLWGCNGNGDFSLYDDGAGNGYIICTMPGGSYKMTLSAERLDKWWANGVPGAHTKRVAGLSWVEGPAVVRSDSGSYHLLFGVPDCGYCVAGTGVATSSSPLGDYERGADVQARAASVGQPRSAFKVDEQWWLWVDKWLCEGLGCERVGPETVRNQTGADVVLYPLTVDADSVTVN